MWRVDSGTSSLAAWPSGLCVGRCEPPLQDEAALRAWVRAVLGATFDHAEFRCRWSEVQGLAPEARHEALQAWLDCRQFRLSPDEPGFFGGEHRLEYCGRGGLQVAYRAPHSDWVFKLSLEDIRTLLAYNLQFAGRALNAVPAQLAAQSQEVLQAYREQRAMLERFFGGHLLDESIGWQEVQMPGRILANLVAGLPRAAQPAPPIDRNALYRFPTFVRVQRYTDLYERPGVLGLQSYWAERIHSNPDLSPAQYRRACRLWNEGRYVQGEPFDRDLFAGVLRTDEQVLQTLLGQADRQPGLRAALADFARRAAAMTRETGHVIDMHGRQNVLFFEEAGRWDYTIVDGQSVHPIPTFTVARQALHDFAAGEPVAHRAGHQLWNGLNYGRLVNGLLHYLALDDEPVRLDGGVPGVPARGLEDAVWDGMLLALRAGFGAEHDDPYPFQLAEMNGPYADLRFAEDYVRL
jgi:hypothetical protein